MFKKIPIGVKLLAAFLTAGLFPLITIVIVSFEKSQHSLEEKAFDRLASVLAIQDTIVNVSIGAAIFAAVLGFIMTFSINRALRGVVVQISGLIKNILAGELDARAQTDQIGVEFEGIINGVNEIVGAFANPINVTSEYVDRISKGDIPSEITKEYHGDFNRNKNNLNGCIAVMNGLLAESHTLIETSKRGKLAARYNIRKFSGSWKDLVNGINEMLDVILQPVNESKSVLKLMATGDLTKRVEGNYEGDHAEIKDAINETILSFNEILGQVNSAAEQIAEGSHQVSISSQSLSEGTSTQASSLEQVSSSLTQMESQTKRNAENASQANNLSIEVRKDADTGNERMGKMVNAMEEINASSKNIYKIIKVIDEIAFQTNLLALNAAVEAARAGKHGKGFAVVAEEVRNLAGRSAKAAKETGDLIENSVKKTKDGKKIAEETASSLTDIVNGITKVTDLVGEISVASNEQAQGISQINEGISQIDEVTQQNSANAEESASAAEELSSQARVLKKMLTTFKLIEGLTSDKIQEINQSQNPLPPQYTEPTISLDDNLKPNNLKSEIGLNVATARTVKPDEIISLDDDEFGRY